MRQSQDDAKKLKNRVWLAIIALILAFLAAASATYAWYFTIQASEQPVFAWRQVPDLIYR